MTIRVREDGQTPVAIPGQTELCLSPSPEGERRPDGDGWTLDEWRLWQELTAEPLGRAHALSRKYLAHTLKVDVREVSEIVKALIEHHGKLIGTDSAGVWIPKDEEEAKRATRNIRRRLVSLAIRLKKLNRWADDEFTDQVTLILENEKEGHRE